MSRAMLATLLSEQARGTAPAPPAELEHVREHTRHKPTGRKPLPEKLPRVEIEVLPPEVQQEGLAAFEKIGEDVAETVERRPASLVVVRTRRPKFVRKDRERLAETGSCDAGSSICPCIGWSAATAEKVCPSRARRSAAGTESWRRWRNRC
jgi:hypothetical protein